VSTLAARVLSVGIRGPGLVDWPSAAAVLAGTRRYEAAPTPLPPPESLPPTERRRAGRVVRLAMAAGLEAVERAGRHPKQLPVVFASSGGDGDNCDAICRTLASDSRALSPTRFHNSVHNAPAGYWSIAAGSQAPTTTVCAFDASFAAGLIEALAQLASTRAEVALVAYDLDYPPPLFAARPTPAPLAIAFVLAPPDAAGPALARIEARLGSGRPAVLADPALEQLRAAIPAGQGLALCEAIARRTTATLDLAYLEPASLAVEIAPCG